MHGVPSQPVRLAERVVARRALLVLPVLLAVQQRAAGVEVVLAGVVAQVVVEPEVFVRVVRGPVRIAVVPVSVQVGTEAGAEDLVVVQ